MYVCMWVNVYVCMYVCKDGWMDAPNILLCAAHHAHVNLKYIHNKGKYFSMISNLQNKTFRRALPKKWTNIKKG